MGYSRQAVAIGLVMASLAALSHSRFRTFVIFALIAATFHRTAIVVLPLIGMSYARNRLGSLVLLAITTLLGYYFLLDSGIEEYRAGYIDRRYEAAGAAVRLSMNFVPALFFLLFSSRFELSDTDKKTWRNFSLLGLLAFASYFFIESSVIVDRLALYVIPLQLFVLSRIPYAFGAKGVANNLLVLLVVIYSALVQFTWLNYSNHARYWVPYQIYPL
jgi:hypothetical protein